MPNIVKCGLIQAKNACSTDQPLERIREANVALHVGLIEQAAKEGVKILCMQEIFTGPYFCAEQTTRWYDATEKIPDGPTTKLMQELAKRVSIKTLLSSFLDICESLAASSSSIYRSLASCLVEHSTNMGENVDPAAKG